ncbi:DUF11 domain-containing protein [Corynebacterium spheniscorum]|uniref:DUF11 domain-containing protein n=1 Tax=Corynebacterium spheniscorum TaxID=185761 RepID=UPI0011604622|nr:DUF11 domain-containing protein [Corynebacterium spheniscorum]KAA8723762.1 hypothetical protein F4V56_02320 [Corynebacterium spheniscorum]
MSQLEKTAFNYSVGKGNWSTQLGRAAKLEKGLNPATGKPYFGIEIGDPADAYYLNSDNADWVVDTCPGDGSPCVLKNADDPTKKIKFISPAKNETILGGSGHFAVEFVGFYQLIDQGDLIQWKFQFDANKPVGNANADRIVCPETDWPEEEGGTTAPQFAPVPTPDLELTKKPRFGKLLRDANNKATVVWELKVTNKGLGKSLGFQLEDKLASDAFENVRVLDANKISADDATAEDQISSPPAGSDLTQPEPGRGMDCSISAANAVSCTAEAFEEGESKTVLVVADIVSGQQCPANTAGITPVNEDPNSSNNTATSDCPSESIALEKAPAADQNPAKPGDQAHPLISFDATGGTASLYYEIRVKNALDVESEIPNDIIDTLKLPAGVEVSGGAVSIEGTELTGVSVGGTTTIPRSEVGTIPAAGEKTLLLRADIKAPLSAWDEAAPQAALTCAESLPTDDSGTAGVLNTVSMLDEEDGTTPESNNHACLSLDADVSIEKTPQPGEGIKVDAKGDAQLHYTVTVHNNSADTAVSVSNLVDKVSVPNGLSISGDVTIDADAVDGSVVNGLSASYPADAWVDGASLALFKSLELGPGVSQTFEITVPVHLDSLATAEAKEVLTTCTFIDDDAGFEGGVPNTVHMDGPDNDGATNNHACIPILPPDPATVSLKTVAYDAQNQTVTDNSLSGAAFNVQPIDESGTPIGEAIPMTGGSDGSPFNFQLEPGRYRLIQTQAPSGGYQLLPNAANFSVTQGEQGYEIQSVDATTSPLVFFEKDPETQALMITVADVRSGVLPKTGPENQMVWIALSLMVAIGVVLLNIHDGARYRLKAGE